MLAQRFATSRQSGLRIMLLGLGCASGCGADVGPPPQDASAPVDYRENGPDLLAERPPFPFTPPPPNCPLGGGQTTEVYLALSAKGGWLSPDALVRPGETVQLAGLVDEFTCDANGNPGAPSHLAKEYHLWKQLPGQLPEAADQLLVPVGASFRSFQPPTPGVYLAQVVDQATPSRKATRRIDVADCGSWVSVGPNANTPQYPDAVATVGRVNALAVDPDHPDRWYSGTANGGVWRTDNAGRYWYPLSEPPSAKSWPQGMVVGRLAVSKPKPPLMAPGDPGRIFAIARNPGFTTLGASWYPSANGGVLVSADGGKTWNPVGGQNCKLPANRDEGQQVLVDPQDPSIVYVLTTKGVFRTTDYGDTCWTEIGQGLLPPLSDMALAVGPNQKTHLFVTAFAPNDTICETVQETDDAKQMAPTWHKTGQLGQQQNCPPVGSPTWTKISAVFDAGANQIRVYAAAAPPFPANLINLFRTAGTGPWEALPGSPNGNACGGTICDGFALVIAANPDAPLDVVLAAQKLYRSNDGGTSWGKYDHACLVPLHADFHAVLFHRASGLLLAGNDGGVFVMKSPYSQQPNCRFCANFECWAPANFGMATTMHYTTSAVARQNYPHGTLASAQDNGHELRRYGRFFLQTGSGDGVDSALDDFSAAKWYGSNYQSGVYRMSDGILVSSLQDRWGPVDDTFGTWVIGSAMGRNPQGFAGSFLAIRADDQIYKVAGADGVAPHFVCIDPQPAALKADDTATHVVAQGPWTYFASIYDDKRLRESIYRYSIKPNSPLGGCDVQPNNVDMANGPPRNYEFPQLSRILDLALDPDDAQAVYATTNLPNADRVLHLVPNGNNSWDVHAIAGALAVPYSGRYSIKASAPMSGDVFVGTPNGMYKGHRVNPNNDNAWTWTQQPEFPVVPVSSIETTETGQLRAGTYGRGVWEQVRCKNGVVANDFDVAPGPGVSEANINVAYASLVFAAPSIVVDGIYNFQGNAGESAYLRVQPLVEGNPTSWFNSEMPWVTAGSGVLPLRIHYLGEPATGVRTTEALRLQVVRTDGSIAAQNDVPVGFAWRSPLSRALHVTAAMATDEGGPFYVPVSVAVTGSASSSSVAAPGFFTDVPGALLTVEAPASVATPKGPATFRRWVAGALDPASVSGLGNPDFTQRLITFSLIQDVALRAAYEAGP